MNPKIQSIKTFENFSRLCRDPRAWEAACLGQGNDTWRRFCVGSKYADPDEEYLRQWLLKHGLEEADGAVFLWIAW